MRAEQDAEATERATEARSPLAELRDTVEAPMSNRAFLRGGLAPPKSGAHGRRRGEP